MRTIHFYSLLTGIFSKHTLRVSSRNADEIIRANTPAEYAAREGVIDPCSQRVDLKTGEVIDYRPAAPDEHHEWNDQRKRWLLKPDIANVRAIDAATREKIAEIERSQQRAVRELAIDATNEVARAKLIETDARIAKLRNVLATNVTAETDTTAPAG